MILIVEIVMLGMGIYALFTGKMKLSKTTQLQGTPARIAGGVMILPLVGSLFFGFMIGLFIGLGLLPTDLGFLATVVEIVLVFGVLIFVYFYGKNHAVESATEVKPTLDEQDEIAMD